MSYVIYDPYTNVSTPATMELLMDLTGMTKANIYSAVSKRTKVRNIDSYIFRGNLDRKTKLELYSKQVIKDEAWRVVEGSDGQYKISTYGRVKRALKKGERFILPMITNRNVLNVKVKFRGVYKQFTIAGLVAHHFIMPRPIGEVVRHKNGITTDNFVGNLEYCTRSRNSSLFCGKAQSKKVVQLDEKGFVINEFRSAREAARKNHLSNVSVLNICRNKHKNTMGLYFMFAENHEDEEIFGDGDE